MEDLQAFNEEIVVRAVFASRIPVISAVGHETDFTLIDFVSDQRAATPSQAAELAVPDREELQRYLLMLSARLTRGAESELADCRKRLLHLMQRPSLREPQKLLASRRQRLDMAVLKLQQGTRTAMTEKQHGLEVAMEKLEMLSPVQVLRRGYGIVEQEGKVLSSVREAAAGSLIKVTLKDGSLSARIESLTGQEG